MTTKGNESRCGVPVAKLLSGKSLSSEERSHLAECAVCLEEVVCQLDQSRGKRDERGREGAECALQHGRKVFEREFDVAL
jgi:hypothetical protein